MGGKRKGQDEKENEITISREREKSQGGMCPNKRKLIERKLLSAGEKKCFEANLKDGR